MGRFLNETMPHANSRMASATTKRRLLREKSTRLRIISYAAVMPRYLPLFKRNHIGRRCMRARILHSAHEPVRQFQNPFRRAAVNGCMRAQLLADPDGAGSRGNVMAGRVLLYAASRDQAY